MSYLLVVITLLLAITGCLYQTPKQAAQGEGKIASQSPWEYCSVVIDEQPVVPSFQENPKTVLEGTTKASAHICYAQVTGCRREVVEVKGDSSKARLLREDVWARVVTKLTGDGWEMLDCPSQNPIHFRRARR